MCVSDFTVATIVVIFGTTNTNFQAKTITEAVTVTVPAATLHITIMVPEEILQMTSLTHHATMPCGRHAIAAAVPMMAPVTTSVGLCL